MPQDPKFLDALLELAEKMNQLVQEDDSFKGQPYVMGVVYGVVDKSDDHIFTFASIETNTCSDDQAALHEIMPRVSAHFRNNLVSRTFDNTVRRIAKS